MSKQQLLAIPLMLALTLTACNSMPPTPTPDPFCDNPRIVFRNLVVAPSGYRYSKRPSNTQKLSFNAALAPSIKEAYGTSLDESFNGVTLPVPIRKQVDTVNAPRDNTSNPTPIANSAPITADTQQAAAPGTTYVPLTFPVPPPKAMMQQFHMKIGQPN